MTSTFHPFARDRAPALLLCLVLSACSVNEFAANSAANIAKASESHMRGFWDYEIARTGTAGAIMQLEAMHSISPDNEALTLTLVSTYVGYAFGYVEVDMEKAQNAGQFEQASRLRARAELCYRRARDLALAAMRKRDDGLDQALAGKPAELRKYLEKHYTDRDEDVAPLFWAASAWGAMLGATEDMGQIVDLPAIRTLVEHSVKLNPRFEAAGALQFLGGFYAQFPAQFGGSPATGKKYFEQALQLTGRRAHMVQVNYARLYAVTTGDKELFFSLLREVIEAGDQGQDVRLANKIARVRAELLLSEADRLF